ncbi:Phosphatidylinositol 4-phosphate 5-kinase 1 [Morella rubra]|uniref:Phosphatidylinositol 4-phosphate 5-kinase 1 n=1 Tax=Morella rubra TaxID=262757 RepID=A0A6A1URQ1_9ROSI|nr:Phosphatidylinositol 4-phosphate 5-kinase 1 [Morella rubra]
MGVGMKGIGRMGCHLGKGTFNCSDGSSNAGNWGKDFHFQVGATRKRSSLDLERVDLEIARNVNFLQICIGELDREAGDIVDNLEASMFYKDGKQCSYGGSVGQIPRSLCLLVNGDIKKPEKMISKGHKNYDLMLNLQLGIRYSVEKHASIRRELRPGDFDPNEKFWTWFPTEGSKCTAPHQSLEFKWKDYCRMVSRYYDIGLSPRVEELSGDGLHEIDAIMKIVTLTIPS